MKYQRAKYVRDKNERSNEKSTKTLPKQIQNSNNEE